MRNRGLSLVETLVATAVISVILAALVLSSLSLQKSFRASEIYLRDQLTAGRLIDYLDSDLRNAEAISVNYAPFRSGEITLSKVSSLEITEAAFYQSNDPASPNYTKTLDLKSLPDPERGFVLQYGEQAKANVIRYFWRHQQQPDSLAIVREENGKQTLLVDDAKNLDCKLSMFDDGKRVGIETHFSSKSGESRTRTTGGSSFVMLRNPRTDLTNREPE
ncbi:unnamed protein product [uncultured bacterium]|nr:unnamed protein product [uncultured bacterium]